MNCIASCQLRLRILPSIHLPFLHFTLSPKIVRPSLAFPTYINART